MIEQVYFVHENGEPTGKTSEKYAAHNADTKLHAAFSCYVFNKNGQFLATQRAHVKKVWHGVWTNTCCGHPFPDESREDAVIRRLEYELGMKVIGLQLIIPTYIYKTPPYNGIIEHECCPIYVAIAESDPAPNPVEVEAYKWVEWDWYVNELESDPTDYSIFANSVPKDEELGHGEVPKWSWWCKDQLKILKKNKKFQKYLKSIS